LHLIHNISIQYLTITRPMASSDQVAIAAKVIRIVHANHAAASDYLHSCKVTPGSTRSEVKDALKCMDLTEYADVLQDLDSTQKTAFFQKVAGMKEKAALHVSRPDKDTVKTYFDVLGLEGQGLRFKDVRKEVKQSMPVADTNPAIPPSPPVEEKKEPHAVPKPVVEKKETQKLVEKKKAPIITEPIKEKKEAPITPARSKIQAKKEKKDKKRKREDDAIRAAPVRPDPKSTGGSDRVTKKQKVEPVQAPQTTKPVRVPTDGLTRDQRKRQKAREKQKQKLLMAKATATAESEKVSVQQPLPDNTIVPSNDRHQQALPINEDVHMACPEPTASTAEEIAPSENAARPSFKSKKVRRSKKKSAKAKIVEADESTEPPVIGSVVVSEPALVSGTAVVPEPVAIFEPKSDVPIEAKKKSRRKRKPKANGPPVSEAPTARDDSDPITAQDEPPNHFTAQGEPPDHVTAQEESSDHEANGGGLSDFIRRTALPILGKPTISATVDSSSEEEQTTSPINSAHDMTTTSPNDTKIDVTQSVKQDTATPETSDDESIADLEHKKLASKIAKQESSPGVDEQSPVSGTGATSVSTGAEVPDSPSKQLMQSLLPVEERKSSPMSKKIASPKPVSTSFSSISARPVPQKPAPSSIFNRSQSSFTSNKSASVQSTDTKKSGNNSFAEFAAFASGKKSGYDSSDDDDESSSSSSDSEDEKPAPSKVLPAPYTVINKEVQGHITEPSPLDHEVHQAPEDESASEPKPSQTDVDAGLGATNEQQDAIASNAAIDVVMTDDQQDASSPITYHESQSSAQDEEDILTESVQVEDNVDEKPEEFHPVSFQSFHESASPQGLPEHSPLSELPNPEDLMEFGGYQPTTSENNILATPVADGEKHTSEPANRDDHEGPKLTEPSNSTELETPFENDDQVMDKDEDLSESGEHVNHPLADKQTLSPIQDYLDPEIQNGQVEHVSRSPSPNSVASGDEPAQAFLDSMDEFLAAWEEETENFATRIDELRKQLESESDGSAEQNINMLEKMMREVDHEEEIYRSKTTAASKAIKAVPQLARERMEDVIDRADASFQRRILLVKAGLEEEYNAESARGQLSPSKEKSDLKMEDEAVEEDSQEEDHTSDEADLDEEVASIAKRSSQASAWVPSDDEGFTEGTKQRRKRKTTGATSKHFTPSPKKKRVPAGTSAVPFPKLSAPRFGLIQERLANDPYRLLIAVTFLNKTAGRVAVPIFEQVMERYATPEDLAAAEIKDLSEMIHCLGFQNQRARKIIRIAETWIEQPPQKGKLYRTMDYPNKGNGRHLKPKDVVEEDVDDCIEAGALEIAHIFGLGPYAWDSWRIFCRDKFRGVANGYNGEGVPNYNNSLQATNEETNFEPEWKRVVPLDKELRACLRWMWLREGWEWDPLSGKKRPAAPNLMREASDGVATWDEPVAVNPHNEDVSSVKEELEGPDGPDALVPGVKVEHVPSTTAAKRSTRRRNAGNSGATKDLANSDQIDKLASPVAAKQPSSRSKSGATRLRKGAVTSNAVEETESEDVAAATPPPPMVPASHKALNADAEIMTSRLRPRASRSDRFAPVPATPSRQRARR
jgi:methyl-CpG-binding domain protein 4